LSGSCRLCGRGRSVEPDPDNRHNRPTDAKEKPGIAGLILPTTTVGLFSNRPDNRPSRTPSLGGFGFGFGGFGIARGGYLRGGSGGGFGFSGGVRSASLGGCLSGRYSGISGSAAGARGRGSVSGSGGSGGGFSGHTGGFGGFGGFPVGGSSEHINRPGKATGAAGTSAGVIGGKRGSTSGAAIILFNHFI
jgi:hypothetical protein